MRLGSNSDKVWWRTFSFEDLWVVEVDKPERQS